MLKFLQKLVKMKKPEQNLREEIINKVKLIAQEAKLETAECPNGCIVKGDESTSIEVQFGGRRDFYETIERLSNEQTKYKVIITSSNVKSMKIKEIKWILNNKFQIKDKWLIIDIEGKESPKTVNFMLYGEKNKDKGEKALLRVEYAKLHNKPQKARRKKIYGKRGKYKVQD